MENEEKVQENVQTSNTESSKKKSAGGLLVLFLVLVAGAIGVSLVFSDGKTTKEKEKEKEVEKKEQFSQYKLTDNNLQDFDLYFLQLENKEENKVFSPISVKYALRMLEDGADGDTKKQISDIVGTYTSKKYVNSSNMSFANGLFIKNSFKDSINESYIKTLQDKYNAEVKLDSFESPANVNKWISDKTFKLVNNVLDDSIKDQEFALINALAINMNWVREIQCEDEECFLVSYPHRDYMAMTDSLKNDGYHKLDFNDKKSSVNSVEFYAIANRYDAVKTIGEDNIRKTVGDEYTKWLKDGASDSCNQGSDPDTNTFLNTYIKELNQGYGDIKSSTDFLFYVDDNTKVFAKDLKSYNGTTLQYVGIMPTKEKLADYVKNMKASEVNKLISNLKSIEKDSFKDGVFTEVHGYIPMFSYNYSLSLKDDLAKLGITDAFDKSKANLSKISSEKLVVNEVSHKTNISFSNKGIKAAAATVVAGGKGFGACGFEHIYEMPIEKIDLTFDKPFVYFVRDKDTGEVWFAGTVYEPIKYTEK